MICRRMRRAGERPLRKVMALCVCRIKLTGARRQVGAEGGRAVTHAANLARPGRGNIPGVPRRGKHVLTAKQNATDSVIRPANLVVVGGWPTVTIQVVIDRIKPASAAVMVV